ncbi:MAG TPA: SWIM zinc finger family protein [Longimicrobium sp.]|nr:SWIM zinc finger family protein [Longimicrobium sp.]
MLISPAFLASLPPGWADADMVTRAASLKVEPVNPGVYMVDGGAEPHWVNTVDDDVPGCDCGDHVWRDRICKHALAVLLHDRDPHARLASWRAVAGVAPVIRSVAQRVNLPVLGLLQNGWYRNPERVAQLFARRPEARRDMIASLLFAGCTTGRRLRSHLGSLCDHITWEEASPRIGGESGACFPADAAHIRAALADVRPLVVVAFGRVAQDGMRQVAEFTGTVIEAPHPAARHPGTQDGLHAASRVLLKAVGLAAPPAAVDEW